MAQLEKAGYQQYEISNSCRPGHEGRHNLLYWDCCDYQGYGPAAHSCVGRVRKYWPDDVQAFIEGTAAEAMEGDCTAEDFLLMQLRLRRGLSLAEYGRWGGSLTRHRNSLSASRWAHVHAEFDEKTLRPSRRHGGTELYFDRIDAKQMPPCLFEGRGGICNAFKFRG